MNAALRISHIDVRPSRHDNSTLEIVLQNIGDEPTDSGVLLLQERLADGSTSLTDFHVSNLLPGERRKLSQAVQGSVRQIDFTGYRSSSDGTATVKLSGLLSWWLSPWSLKAA
jgi:hypothetical protein